jgi:hypothetical protein
MSIAEIEERKAKSEKRSQEIRLRLEELRKLIKR